MKLRLALLAILAISGSLLGARAILGPLEHPLAVNSPMNLEGCFALAFLALILLKDRPRHSPAGKGWDPALAIALALIVVAAFARFLDFPLLADDYIHIWNARHADLHAIWAHFTVPETDRFFRPLAYCSYALDALWAGISPTAWRAGNLAFHILNSLLVYWFCRELGFGRTGAFVGALIFGLHGSRPEAVTWVAARFDLMAVTFGLLSLITLLRGSPRWIPAVFLVLALMSKESAYVVPLLAVACLWFIGLRWREIGKSTAPLFATAALALAYRIWLLHGIGGYHDPGTGSAIVFHFGLASTLNALLVRFWAVMLFPLNWTGGLGTLTALLFAFGILAMAYLAFHAGSRRKVLLGLIVAMISALPAHQFLAIGMDLEKSRVIYFATVGLAILFAAIFEQLDGKLLLCAVVLIAFHSAALLNNLVIWREVGELAGQTCAAQAKLGRTAPSGLPNIVDGVYFLKMGFPECVLFLDPTAQPGKPVIWDPVNRSVRE